MNMWNTSFHATPELYWIKMLPLDQHCNSLSKEVLHAYVLESLEFCAKIMLSGIAIISQISRFRNILKICCRPKYNLHSHWFLGQYLYPVQSYRLKKGFLYMLQSVGHLELDLNQNVISSSPFMRDISCKWKSKYVYRFFRYVGAGNRRTDRQTDRQKQARTLSPARKEGDEQSLCRWFQKCYISTLTRYLILE